MADYKDPRPSPTASASDPCVIYDNAVSFDGVVNGDTTVTTYAGKELLTLSQAIDKFGFGVADFTFTTGGTLDSLNLLVSNSPTDGFLYKYVGAGAAPIVVTAGTDPTAGGNWQAFAATDHDSLNGLNSSGHNPIYSRRFDSIALMQSYSESVVNNVYRVNGAVGCNYKVTSASQNISSISISNGLFATPINTSNLYQYGMVGAEGEDITQPMLKALANGLKSFSIPQRSVVLSQSVDLSGATVNGSNTDLVSGALINGVINDVHRVTSPIRGGGTAISTVSKSATKLMYREAVLDNGSVSPNGEMYSIISPSSCGGVARFTLTNGLGASGVNDAGAPYDRLRPVQSFIYQEGFAILRTPSAQSGGVTDSTASLSDTLYNGLPGFQYASDGIKAINAKQVPFNDYVEYSIYGAANTANVVFRASSGSPSLFEIRVNGELVKTVSCVRGTAEVRVVSIPIDVGTTNTVRVTNASTGTTGFVWGCNLFNLHELPKTRRGVNGFFDKVVCFGGGRVAAGIGASMDTVVINDAGIYCGSYHGGDVSTSCLINMGRSDGGRFGVKTSTVASPTTPMGAGVYSSDVIITRYNGVIDDANLSIWVNYDFSVDGGCYVRFNYQALTAGGSDLSAMYTAMHGSDRGLVNTPLKTFVEATPTNGNTEIPLSISPMLQYSNDGRAVSISTKMYESDYTNIGQYVWDNTEYLKFYYMPIAGTTLNIKNSDVISSDCLYQLGNALV